MNTNLKFIYQKFDINWKCNHTWKASCYNTFWCLIGCSIGDLGTIAYFQFMDIKWPVYIIMVLAIIPPPPRIINAIASAWAHLGVCLSTNECCLSHQ